MKKLKKKHYNNITIFLMKCFQVNNNLDQTISNNKKRNYASIAQDSGFTHNRRIKINGNIVPYTEDRPINFYFGDNDRFNVIGVTDGRGGSSTMSVLASNSFPIYLQDNLLKNENNIEDALLKTFENINELSHSKNDESGTTLTVCVIDTLLKKAHIANLGNSVTQIFRRNIETDKFTSIFRTIDHDAKNIKEQERISQNFDTSQFECENDNKELTYAKYNDHKTKVVGGFGDFNFPEGFIRRIPDIITIDLCEGDVIICSSDGYYETYDIKSRMLNLGRNESEITNDLDILYNSNNLYSSPTLAKDLIEMHLDHIVNIFMNRIKNIGNITREQIYKKIKNTRDNNTLVTYTL